MFSLGLVRDFYFQWYMFLTTKEGNASFIDYP